MKKSIFITCVALTTILSSCGDAQQKSETTTKSSTETTDAAIKLCGDCGEIKGSANCCSKDAERCGKCGLIKGTAGCCKIQGDTELCSKCGEIKGSDNCCNKEAEKCPKCGLIKGSPGCCKINR